MGREDQSVRRVGRPAKKVLSRSSITEAALGLLDTGEYERFTVAALAGRLGVAPSALYNHVQSKRDLLVWVQDHLMSSVDATAFGRHPWDEAVTCWAWSYREVFASHAPLVPIIAVLPVTGAEGTLRMYETVAHGLIRGGWPGEQVVPVITAIESFIYGSALDLSAPQGIFHTGSLADEFPVFTAVVRTSSPTGGTPADSAFTLGLDALVAGLKARLGHVTLSRQAG